MTMLIRGGAAGAGSALPTGATTGQVLQWNGSAWVAATPSASGTTPNATPTVPGLVQLAGDLGGTATAPTVAKINGAAPAAVATSGSYTDLTGRPALATVATSGSYGDLTGRPLLATVATSGSYTDLTNRPTIPTAPTILAAAKAAATARANTATQTLDPDLFATVQPGTYRIDLTAAVDATTGLQLAVGGTATFTNPIPGAMIVGSAPNVWTAGANGFVGTSASNLALVGQLIAVVTAAGTLGISWSQYSAGASATTIRAGSGLVITKLS